MTQNTPTPKLLATPKKRVQATDEPRTPGIYAYDAGAHKLTFALDKNLQWWVYAERDIGGIGHPEKCEWGYISQALGSWHLVLIEAAK